MSTLVDLAAIEVEHGPLYSFWNHHPPCPGEGCDDTLTFIATREGDGVWPLHMKEGEPGQVRFIQAAWRADRLNNDLGGRLALQLMIGVIRQLSRYSMFTIEERREVMRDAVATLPTARQDDATWLIEHYVNLGQERPGWR